MEKYCFSSKQLILIIVDINPCCAEFFHYLIVESVLIVAQLTIISLLYNVDPRLGTRETCVNPDPQ